MCCDVVCWQFVSVGEDAVVNVWSLPERSSGSYKVSDTRTRHTTCCGAITACGVWFVCVCVQVELLCSKSVEDHLFTGVQFFKSPRMAVLASSYDNCVMALIQ